MRDADEMVEDALTTGRRSGRGGRVELITRSERRRSWTTEQKRTIAGESLEAGSSPSAVARRHGIGTGLLYTWRRQLLQGALDAPAAAAAGPSFARVEVMALPAIEAAAAGDASLEPEGTTAPAPSSSRMEIVLSGGAVVRVDGTVEEAALRRVLSALSSR